LIRSFSLNYSISGITIIYLPSPVQKPVALQQMG
jgi:hypothetical protein